MVRAFLFDMDGVLVDSTRLHTETWEIYLQRHGLAADNIKQKMLGKRNDELVPVLFGQTLTAGEVAYHGSSKEALYRELLGPRFQDSLVPGVVRFLRRRPEMPKALATNAEPANVDFILERAGVRDCFQAVVDGYQVPRPKPAPDIYLRAAHLLGVAPADCVVFEDSPAGVEAGLAAGARVVALTTTVSAFQDVDLVIRDFEDQALEAWLATQYTGV